MATIDNLAKHLHSRRHTKWVVQNGLSDPNTTIAQPKVFCRGQAKFSQSMIPSSGQKELPAIFTLANSPPLARSKIFSINIIVSNCSESDSLPTLSFLTQSETGQTKSYDRASSFWFADRFDQSLCRISPHIADSGSTTSFIGSLGFGNE
jgi:hypothetical protein